MAARTLLAIACASIVSIATSAFAQDFDGPAKEGRIRISSMITKPDPDRGTKDGAGMEIAYGRPWKEHWSWEAVLFNSTLETGDAGMIDHYQTAVGFNVIRWFGDENRMIPFFTLGGGAINDDVHPDSMDEVNPYVMAGGGIYTRELGQTRVRLRLEGQYIWDDHRDGMNDIHYQLGAVIPIGRQAARERIVYRDREVPTAALAAPAPAPPAPPPAPLDSDRDGVVDALDRCANTLAGAVVDELGCIRAVQSIELQGVNFETGSAQLTESAQRILDRVFLSLRDQPNITVEIAGHTDSSGAEVANLLLSQARAESVRATLVGRGIAETRLTAHGYGESQPVTSEITDEDRARNRRVEFRVKDLAAVR